MPENETISYCTVPAGYVAVPLHQYQNDIASLARLHDKVLRQDAIIQNLKEIKARLDEIEDFFKHEDYAVTLFDRYRKQKAEQEAKDAETEDA